MLLNLMGILLCMSEANLNMTSKVSIPPEADSSSNLRNASTFVFQRMPEYLVYRVMNASIEYAPEILYLAQV